MSALPSGPTPAAAIIRRLMVVWSDFESRLLKVPVVDRAMRGVLRIEDYRQILLNHRQQVIEGSRWIACAAASIDNRYPGIRSRFIRHAVTEHLDYQMLDESFLACGGTQSELEHAQKNIGTEALSAWMFHRASRPNPFDLIGAMFIIEGLGQRFAQGFARKIQEQLDLTDQQIKFYLYHAEHDPDHLDELEAVLNEGIADIDGMSDAIVKTGKVTARLYLLQLEELGNY